MKKNSFSSLRPPHLNPLPRDGGEGRVRGNCGSSHGTFDLKSRATLLVIGLLALMSAACGRDLKTAQGVAEEFVDQHYVHIDLRKAKEFAVSVALEKINEEIRLTTGQVIDASTRKPSVHYRLVEKKESEGRVSFLYEGTIRVEDAPEFSRRWLIVTRKDGGQWRVSNFTESD